MNKNKEAKPLNPAAADMLAKITVGSILISPDRPWDGESVVAKITEKSVWFTDGTYTAKRSLHHFVLKG